MQGRHQRDIPFARLFRNSSGKPRARREQVAPRRFAGIRRLASTSLLIHCMGASASASARMRLQDFCVYCLAIGDTRCCSAVNAIDSPGHATTVSLAVVCRMPYAVCRMPSSALVSEATRPYIASLCRSYMRYSTWRAMGVRPRVNRSLFRSTPAARRSRDLLRESFSPRGPPGRR